MNTHFSLETIKAIKRNIRIFIKIIVSILRKFILFDLLFTFCDISKAVSIEFARNFPFLRKRDISEEVVLITGGASGLGKLLAENFLKAGATVVIVDINKKELSRARNKLAALESGTLFAYVCDVGIFDDVKELYKTVRNDVGFVSILVNNAGIVCGQPFTKISEEEIIKTFKVNVFSHFWMLKKFLPSMIENDRGQVVTIASAAGIMGVPGLAEYAASKHAVIGMTESIRLEAKRMGARNVSTTLICPYFINTGMFDGVKTRFPLLLPILDPNYVAAKTFDAILKRRTFVAIPKFVYSVFILRYLPTVVFDITARFLGVMNSMDLFTGRKKKNT